jgi:hypothetical protein
MRMKAMSRYRLTAAVGVLLAGAGCSHTISINLTPQTLTVVTYSQGKADRRCSIAPDSAKFRKLSEFMKQSAQGWHSRSSDYTPSLVVIGTDINLYFMGDSVVMNYSGGEYSRTVSPDSYAFLDCKAT